MLTKTPPRAAPPPASADAAAVDSNELQRKTSRRGRPKGTHKLDPLWYAYLLQNAYLIELDAADGGNLYFRTADSGGRGRRPKHVSNRQIADLLKRRGQYRHLTTGRLRQYLPGNRAAAPPALQHSTDRMSAREFVKFHIESWMWSLWFALSKTPDENQMISLASHTKNLRAQSVTVIVEECSLPAEFAEIVVTNTARLMLLDLLKRFYAPFFPSEWGGPRGGGAGSGVAFSSILPG
jgi:hypothetical protein